MAYRISEPVFTTVIDDPVNFRPEPGSLYLSGLSAEDRSSHVDLWKSSAREVAFSNIVETSAFTCRVERDGAGAVDVQLRSSASVQQITEVDARSAVYLDITGLSHRVWAPILRALRRSRRRAFGVYVEPRDYRRSTAPTELGLFDLSERIDGIAPLPGFASLVSDDLASRLVVLLGFEGARLRYALEAANPNYGDVYPVVGAPGFRPDYPFTTLLGNKSQLLDTGARHNIRFAAANCPFSVYRILEEISFGSITRAIKIAMIGTKPHAFGAVLYWIDNQERTELVYDHPVRKRERTSGSSRLCLYDLSLLEMSTPI